FADSSLPSLIEPVQVLRVNATSSFLIRDQGLRGIESEYPVRLWRPVKNFASDDIMRKAPGMAKSLGFGQICLAAPQGVFCLFPVINVGRGSVPTNDLALWFPVWVVKEQEPAIVAFSGKKPRFGLERGTAGDTVLPRFPKPGQIVRMQMRASNAFVQELLQRQAPEVQRNLIGIEAAPIRGQHHHLVRNSVHKLGQLLLRSLAFGDIANDRQTSDDIACAVTQRRKIAIQEYLLRCLGEDVRNVGCYEAIARE